MLFDLTGKGLLSLICLYLDNLRAYSRENALYAGPPITETQLQSWWYVHDCCLFLFLVLIPDFILFNCSFHTLIRGGEKHVEVINQDPVPSNEFLNDLDQEQEVR